MVKHTRRNSFTGQDLNAEPPVVEVLNVDGSTSQSSDQLDLTLVEEVVFLTGEAGVGLLLNLENDVTGLDARGLVTLTTELNLGTAPNTAVDVNVENLAVDDCLLAVALLAAVLVLDGLTLAIAVGADGLEALDHGTHLSHHGLHAVAVTAGAALNGAVLSTATFALGANDGALKGELGDLAPVDVLKGDLVSVVNGAGLGGTAVGHTTAAEHAAEATAEAATAEELSEQVLSSHTTTTASTTLKTGLAILVVDLTLLGIGKDLVGVGDLLELLFSLGVVGVLVCLQSVSKLLAEQRNSIHIPGWYFRAFVL